MKKIKVFCSFLFFTASLYSQVNVSLVGVLDDTVTETSGLIFYNDRLITHNDSGNMPLLYEIDTVTLQVTRTVSISNISNTDWEDLAQDENHIYIADIGNNNGDRTDLAIYRISKSDYDTSDSVTAERIGFSYEDQTDFQSNPNSDWDAEALTVIRGQLTLFTKQWQSNGSTAYAIPNSPGDQIAVNLGTAQVGGLVTGATFNEATNILYLLGYTALLQPFLVKFEDPPGPFSFGGSGEFINLGIGFAQAEGITYVDENTYYISTERFNNPSPPIALEASLYRIETQDTIAEPEPPPEPEPEPEPEPPGPEPPPGETEADELILYREFGSSLLMYQLNTEEDIFGRAIFDVHGRIIQYTPAAEIHNNNIDISTFGSSVYYLTFYLRNKILARAFIAN